MGSTLFREILPSSIKEADGDQASFTITTETPDRVGDSVKAAGLSLTNYKKNPVVLWAHDYAGLPIGKAVSIVASATGVKAIVRFATAENPMAATVYNLVRAGYLSAVSIGFRALEVAANEYDGWDITKSELLEFSVVPVPMHPEALIEARAAGIDVEPMLSWAKGLVAAHEDPAAALLEATVKAGRVLSTKYHGLIKTAHEALTAVLAAMPVDAPAEEEPEEAPAKASPPPAAPAHVIRLLPSAPQAKRYTIQDVQEATNAAVRGLVNDKLRRLSGKLED